MHSREKTLKSNCHQDKVIRTKTKSTISGNGEKKTDSRDTQEVNRPSTGPSTGELYLGKNNHEPLAFSQESLH